MRAVPGDTVGFVKIDEFKERENDAVMVADLLETRFSEHDPVSQIVAMVIRDPCWRELLHVHRIAL